MVRAVLTAPPPNSITLLKKIAHELGVPEYFFFLRRVPPLNPPLLDFRAEKPAPATLGNEARRAIDVAQDVQRLARKVGYRSAFNIQGSLAELENESFALDVRDKLQVGVSEQASVASPDKFYKILRFSVETTGIFVLQSSFDEKDGSGCALASKDVPVAVINTRRQNSARRSFTLVHELAHLILGNNGIIDPFEKKNRVEVACNRFAANFLMPAAFVKAAFASVGFSRHTLRRDIAAIARKMSTSQQATALRLETLELVRQGTYDAWLQQVQGANPDFGNSGGGGGRVEEEKYKLASYGFTFARVFSAAVDTGQIDEVELHRSTGLKAKWQQRYFEFAENAVPVDAGD